MDLLDTTLLERGSKIGLDGSEVSHSGEAIEA